MAANSTPTQQGTPVAATSHAADGFVADPERQPLLDKPSEKRQNWWPFSSSAAKKTQQEQDDEDDWDSTQYDITQMSSWSAFGMVKGCAWDNSVLWGWIGLALLLASAVAAVVVFVPDAVLVNPQKLAKLGTFLNVFVGLLLGFFLTSSMNRWYACVDAFLELLDAVRSMQMQMTALGVAQEKAFILSRYGVLSAWLLHLSLNMESNDEKKSANPDKEEQERVDKVWQKLEQFRPELVLPQEREKLKLHKESYALLWTWVASLIGRMSQDGEIPPMASPTYGRILNIVQEAYGSIRNVRALQLIKAPFIYIHTLAILVHVNNILNAVSFGLVLGITISGTTMGGTERKDLVNMYISLFMQFCFSMLAPILYLALLDVSMCISQPFTYRDAKIPAIKYIRCLEEDLQKAVILGDNPPHWEKPSFKKK